MMDLSFEVFARTNLARCNHWHPTGITEWTLPEWAGDLPAGLGRQAALAEPEKPRRLPSVEELAEKSAVGMRWLAYARVKDLRPCSREDADVAKVLLEESDVGATDRAVADNTRRILAGFRS